MGLDNVGKEKSIPCGIKKTQRIIPETNNFVDFQLFQDHFRLSFGIELRLNKLELFGCPKPSVGGTGVLRVRMRSS